MSGRRRVALVFDPDRFDHGIRGMLAGIRRYVAETRRWQCTLDPLAARHLAGAYDGVIAPALTRIVRACHQAKVPPVFVTWHRPDWHGRRLTRVLANRYQAGRFAARHLLERGYRAFGYVGFKHGSECMNERKFYRHWLRWRGWPAAHCLVPTDYKETAALWGRVQAALSEWLDKLARPSGIYCTRDELARQLADLAANKGLRIPEDVGIIAAGNDPAVCEFPAPTLSSVEFDYPEVGYRAAELLDRLMDGGQPPRRNVLIPPTVVPRRSTDRESVADPLVADAVYWIATHSWEPIRPAHVAAAFGLSLRTLEARFHRSRGRTIVREIDRARVEHARILLGDPAATLAGVAHLTGFPSQHAMRRAFRRIEDTTPGAHRTKMIRRRDAQAAAKAPTEPVNVWLTLDERKAEPVEEPEVESVGEKVESVETIDLQGEEITVRITLDKRKPRRE